MKPFSRQIIINSFPARNSDKIVTFLTQKRLLLTGQWSNSMQVLLRVPKRRQRMATKWVQIRGEKRALELLKSHQIHWSRTVLSPQIPKKWKDVNSWITLTRKFLSRSVSPTRLVSRKQLKFLSKRKVANQFHWSRQVWRKVDWEEVKDLNLRG